MFLLCQSSICFPFCYQPDKFTHSSNSFHSPVTHIFISPLNRHSLHQFHQFHSSICSFFIFVSTLFRILSSHSQKLTPSVVFFSLSSNPSRFKFSYRHFIFLYYLFFLGGRGRGGGCRHVILPCCLFVFDP